LWDNVKQRQVNGNTGVEILLGVDFKQRNKNRNAREGGQTVQQGNPLANSGSKQQSASQSPVKKEVVKAPENLFNEESSSEEEDMVV
jgi:hypothetical protein